MRVAVGLVVLLVLGVIVASRFVGGDDTDTSGETAQTSAAPRTGPVALVTVDAPGAGSAECRTLTGALPDALPNAGDALDRLPLAEPAPPATAAWGDQVREPVVLRCGLNRPAELTPTSPLRVIDDVQWLVVPGESAATWYVVDRGVYIALTVPEHTGTGPLQQISATVASTLDPAPVRTR
ncbi:DUF3515 domain-containing protein [Actinophytocola sp. S1-96]|uniref:DUF3515 domain-containing protein n=1 Tax=Actinophytocola gossypii TaxID=2812003 RepID=A0ABT2JAA1_9PSEU|nr:DUF3515 domain-containing protein [Actinophytocola gossypii]